MIRPEKTASRPIYIDIDGVLTSEPERKWGPVIDERLDAVRRLVESGHRVILWSGGGRDYAQQFSDKYSLSGVVCEGKPSICIDDNPCISPSMSIVGPDWLESIK